MLDPKVTGADEDPRVLIIAFNGWSDAGNASTLALKHLQSCLDVDPVHVIGADGYIDLQMYRPMLTKLPSGERVIEWPDARLYAPVLRAEEATSSGVTTLNGEPVNNIFLLDATEPAHQWMSYADEILDLIEVWEIDLVLFMGAMFSDAPHTRPIHVLVTSEDPDIRTEFDAEDSNYEGPVGISTVLSQMLVAADIPSVSLWAQVPHYVHSAPSPKATLALIDRCEELLDIVVPRGSLLDEANDWENSINALAGQDDEMTHYIERLEEARDSIEGPESTGEAIAHEFEKFLQIRPEDEGRDDGRTSPGN